MKRQLEQCYAMHSQRLLKFSFGVAYNLGLTHETAEDAFQEAFVKLYQVFGNGQTKLEPTTIYTWLKTTVRNYLLNKKKICARINNFGNNTLLLADTAVDIAKSLEIEEEIAKVKFWITQLPAIHSQVIYLRIYQNLSTRETAQTLDISEGTVKSRLQRALASLREYLANEEAKNGKGSRTADNTTRE